MFSAKDQSVDFALKIRRQLSAFSCALTDCLFMLYDICGTNKRERIRTKEEKKKIELARVGNSQLTAKCCSVHLGIKIGRYGNSSNSAPDTYIEVNRRTRAGIRQGVLSR